MKVFVKEFATELNTNIPTMCTIKQYDIGFGEDYIQKMGIREVFKRNDATLIPSIYADTGAAGIAEKSVFTYIEHMFVDTLKKNLYEADDIFLILHGASEMEEPGLGDYHISKELRKLAGPYLSTAIVYDPHGSLRKEYAESATILRSYRESSHMDADKTVKRVVEMLCELLKKQCNIHTICHKPPLILGGEQSISADEPVLSINRYMDELEKDDRILSCPWHVGYIRHGCDVIGCGIIAVPYSEQGLPYVQEATDRLVAYVQEKRYEFHYVDLTASSSKALQMALDFQDKPVFITNPDDNIASGATGWNTGILRQVPQTGATEKFSFTVICDPAAYQTPSACKTREELSFTLGVGFDGLSSAVELDAVVKDNGNLTSFTMHDHTPASGYCVNTYIEGISIDIMVTDAGWAVCELYQFVNAGIDVGAYDVIVVRRRYILPDFRARGEPCVVSLTEGVTLQDTARLPFKRVTRPMFPIDDI